ncbi:MAG TPA: hypothetical protein VI844_01460 [Coxiellaceae bacterium]|nr:hypothetical protein [Coxiellaceae bacterium]
MPKLFHVEPTKLAEWRNLLIDGQEKAGLSLTEALENYVVLTLDAYTTETKLASVVLAIEFLENIRASKIRDFQKLRSVGDQCLILAGLFPERARHKRVSDDYFKNLGENAYYVLSYARTTKQIDHRLFYQLFENFAGLTEVLKATRLPANHRTYN